MLILAVFAALNLNAQIQTPQPSPSSHVEQVVGLTKITMDYSRPAMRGRVVFGDLVPFGDLWRTGANANTVISFSDDVTVGGQALAKGKYALYSIPNKDNWEIIFYADTSNWGTPAEWDEKKVAAKFSVASQEMPWTSESFTLLIDDLSDNNASINIMWEKTMVNFKVEVPTQTKAMASIENAMSGPSANDYFSAASYYLSIGKDLDQAETWASKAVEIRPEAYWMWRGLSLIQHELGDDKNAVKSAKKSLELATKAGNQDYVRMNEKSIAAWK